jgi:chemotaxis signal transduction protein
MDLKYLIAGISGYKIGIPLEYVLGVEIIEPHRRVQFYSDGVGTIQFRGSQIAFVNLRKRLNGGEEVGNILLALHHPFTTLGISVDMLEGIFECDEITPIPEIIKKATDGLLLNFGFINDRIFFTINVQPLLSLEQFRMLESGVAA